MDEKSVEWLGSSFRDLLAMPETVRRTFGYALGLAQNGLVHPDTKELKGFSPKLVEVLENYDGDTYRAVYTARFENVVYVLHCFQKKSTRGRKLPRRDLATIEARLADLKRIESTRTETKDKNNDAASRHATG